MRFSYNNLQRSYNKGIKSPKNSEKIKFFANNMENKFMT